MEIVTNLGVVELLGHLFNIYLLSTITTTSTIYYYMTSYVKDTRITSVPYFSRGLPVFISVSTMRTLTQSINLSRPSK